MILAKVPLWYCKEPCENHVLYRPRESSRRSVCAWILLMKLWVHCTVTKDQNKPECTFSSLSGKMEASRIAFWTQYFHIARSKHNRVQEHLFRYSGYVRGLIIWLHMPPSQKSFSPIFFFWSAKCLTSYVHGFWPLLVQQVLSYTSV